MAKKKSRLMEAMFETAEDMRSGGLISQARFEKITMRHIAPETRQGPHPLTPQEIRAVREREHMSQAVFAQRLNVSPAYISQLERGVRHAAGATLALLDAIQRKGIEAVL